ncbi:MAG: protein O-mannosyl-transferase [Verrucomicrobiota bacterium]|jgi:tetratricopeptide (TPR) repeat protein
MDLAPITTLASGRRKSLFDRTGALIGRTWVRCVILALLGFAVHFPSLQGQLIWDDQYLAHDNPLIKSPLLVLENFRHYLFVGTYSTHYRPVQNVSYIVDYLIWNNDPYGFHLSNVLCHVASAVLLFLLLEKLLAGLVENGGATFGRRSIVAAAAFCVALLWVVHPVHSAAVDYISGRADSLAFFFSCGAWLLYLRARALSRRLVRVTLFFLAGISLLLGLCSRESAFLWLLVFLVHLFAFEKRLVLRSKFLVAIACLCVAASYAGLRHLAESGAATTPAMGWSAPVRATLILRALGDYGRLLSWPTKLHMERTVFDVDSLQSNPGWRNEIGIEYLSIGGLLMASILLIGSCRKGCARPVRAFGAAWFFLAFLPVSNLFDLNATVAEHWLYLPSVGFLIFAAGCCLDFSRSFLRFAPPLACIAALALGARSYVRSTDWVDDETFYRRTVEAGGTSIRVALNLGQIYSLRGEYAQAEVLYRKILKISPEYLIARTNLGDALFHQGKMVEANALFAAAKQAADKDRNENPRSWIAALNLAHMRYKENDFEGALAVTTQALADYPGTWELVSYQAELTRRLCGPDAALPLMRGFADRHWWHAGAFMALGRLWTAQGDVEKAEAAFRHASWLDIHDAESLNLIVAIKVGQNQLDAACEIQRRAVARQPDQPRQYLLLSDILEKMGRHDEAQAVIANVQVLEALAKSQTRKVAVN